jgi:hypothetical protein
MQRFALAEIAAGSLIGKLPSGLAVTIAVRDMSGAAIALTSAVCTEQGTTGMYRWALTNITVPPIAFAEYTYVMTSANNDTYEDVVVISGYPDVINVIVTDIQTDVHSLLTSVALLLLKVVSYLRKPLGLFK